MTRATRPLRAGWVDLASALPIALTALPLVNRPKWWLRLWDYPRLQIAVGLAAAAALQAGAMPRAARRPGLLPATLACLAWQAAQIYPYTRAARMQTAPARAPDPLHCISILVANVLQDNRDADAFLARVEAADPDVVLAVETDRWWGERIAGLRVRYPHAVLHPLDNTYGMHLFSRLELADVRLQDRVTRDIPSIFARVRLRSGQQVSLHCVHPEPPQVGNDVHERNAELLLVAREVAADRHPAIVCGDLNDVAWSHTTRLFQRISGLLDPRVGRGLYPTFHAEHWFARWPLDHVFHDASFALDRLEVLDYFGSDHFPVLMRLVHDPAAAHRHVVPQADAADWQEASDRIAEGCEAAVENAHAAGSCALTALPRQTDKPSQRLDPST